MIIQYVIAGLAFGGVYAIAASALVTIYTSSGILNLAFGASAYFIARCYYYFHTQAGWSIPAAALLSLGVIAPVMGIVLWAGVWRHVRLAPQFVKLASTIGLAIAIPALASLIFGNTPIQTVPGLAPEPVAVFHPFGVAVSMDTVIIFGSTALVLLIGGVLLQFTVAGLKVRATVDSEAMTALSGVSPLRVSLVVAVATTVLTGLAGILAGPLIGLTTDSYLLFMTAAFAAMVAGKLRNVGTAVGVGLVMGVVTGLAERYLPPRSTITADLITAIPLITILVSLVVVAAAGRGLDMAERVGGKLDLAIRPVAEGVARAARRHVEVRRALGVGHKTGRAGGRWSFGARVGLLCVAILILPLIVQGFWLDLVASGFAFALAFLPITLLSGEGGMLWLCQITFAGVGALAMGQLAGVFHWPILVALLVSGIIAVPLGVVVGVVTIRLGEIYVALVTVTVGLLIETVVYNLPRFYQGGIGVNVPSPSFAAAERSFAYFAAVLVLLAGLFLMNWRQGTTGRALRAATSSPGAARTLGINVTRVRLLAAAVGAFGSGLGGAVLAMHAGAAFGGSFITYTGLVWFAVVVTMGVRSIAGAVFAGLMFAVMPGIFAAYLPLAWAPVPTCLFGLGAMAVARNTDGLIAMHARQLRAVGQLLRRVVQPTLTAFESAAGRRPTPSYASVETSPQLVPSPTVQDTRVLELTSPTPAGESGRAGANGRAQSDRGGRTVAQPVDLEIRGVSVSFGGVHALVDVDMQVAGGSFTGLIGPNGAGKTTLFGAISGTLRPQKGQVLVDGNDVTELPIHERARRGLGRTFQHTELFAGLTVRDHLVLADRARHSPRQIWTDAFSPRGLWGADDPAETGRVDELLDLLRLGPIADRPALGLSAGQSRLVEVGRALAAGPTVLLLDEPSTGLDTHETDALARTLRDVVTVRTTTVILIEHDVQMVLGLAELVFVLDFGRIIATGPPDEIRHSRALRDAYFGDEDVLASRGGP